MFLEVVLKSAQVISTSNIESSVTKRPAWGWPPFFVLHGGDQSCPELLRGVLTHTSDSIQVAAPISLPLSFYVCVYTVTHTPNAHRMEKKRSLSNVKDCIGNIKVAGPLTLSVRLFLTKITHWEEKQQCEYIAYYLLACDFSWYPSNFSLKGDVKKALNLGCGDLLLIDEGISIFIPIRLMNTLLLQTTSYN